MSEAVIIVAGHICLDLIPTVPSLQGQLNTIPAPGHKLQAGPMEASAGGAVANTGLALHYLGTPVRLLGKIGRDPLGRMILDVLSQHNPTLSETIVVDPGARSSYTVILSAPQIDRPFLYYPGPNDTFCAADVSDEVLEHARVLHLGYPPLLRRMALDDGQELVALFARARTLGLITSLDMTMPDPTSEAGRIDWAAFYHRVLPWVDVFLPNLEETLFTLDNTHYVTLTETAGEAGLLSQANGKLLSGLAERLLALGVSIVGLKLGQQGMYLRTTANAARLASIERTLALPKRAWHNRELLAPAFQAKLVGTKGVGDCAVAGFLAGLMHRLPPEDTLRGAVAVSACTVEAANGVRGTPTWADVWERVTAGWEQIPTTLRLKGWGWSSNSGLWIGPADRGGQLCAAGGQGCSQ